MLSQPQGLGLGTLVLLYRSRVSRAVRDIQSSLATGSVPNPTVTDIGTSGPSIVVGYDFMRCEVKPQCMVSL